MMGLGRWEEFRMHLRSALEDKMSLDDIREIFMQQAIYCGLPIANTAFHHLDDILAELRERGVAVPGV
jgi:alkylhydroperoxidase/carboxymuconolactone decarboxylase family protein YurZ